MEEKSLFAKLSDAVSVTSMKERMIETFCCEVKVQFEKDDLVFHALL